MSALFIFPPFWGFSKSPHLSTTILTKYLRDHQIKVSQVDLNNWSCWEMVSKPFLKRIYTKIDNLWRNSVNLDPELNDNLIISKAILESFLDDIVLAAHSYSNVSTSTSPDMLPFLKTISILDVIVEAAFPGEKLDIINSQYHSKLFSLQPSLDNAIHDVEHHGCAFLEYLISDHFLSILSEVNPSVLGISIASKSQFVPSILLGKLCKQSNPNTVVVIGGAYIPYVKEAVNNNSNIFKYIDYLVVGEGELPSLAIYHSTLSSHTKPTLIPNSTYHINGITVNSNKHNGLSGEDLSIPDFSDFASNKYFICETVLPVLGSRGCYWNRCSFCSIGSSHWKYRELPINRLFESIRYQQKKYNCSYFEFCDLAITPLRFSEISNAVAPLGIHWDALLRLEKDHCFKSFQLAYRSGCRLVSWGLESASDGVLRSMNKGVTVKHFERILKQSHDAGLFNHIFIMVGYPGETDEDVETSFRFIERNRDYIDSVICSPFILESESPAFTNLNNLGLELKKHPTDYCDEEFDFSYKDATAAERLNTAIRAFHNRFSGMHFYPGNFDAFDGTRLLVSVSKYGKSAIRSSNNDRTKLTDLINRITHQRVQFHYSCHGISKSPSFELYDNKVDTFCIVYNSKTGALVVLREQGVDDLFKMEVHDNITVDQLQLGKTIKRHDLIRYGLIEVV